MRVYVTHLYDDTVHLYEGTPTMLENQLMVDYPWLRTPDITDRGDVDAVLEHLESSSSFMVELEDDHFEKSENHNLDEVAGSPLVQSMLGFSPQFTESFRAAKFLAGGREIPFDVIRRALWKEEGNLDHAALRAYGFEVNDANVTALNSVKPLAEMRKDEAPEPTAQTVTAATPDGTDVAHAVARAYKDRFVMEVKLAGKHSTGTLIARDEATHKTYLLKPGAGGAGGSAGAMQDPSSQAAREAAWYHVAKAWGLFDYFPRAELLLIDGRQYAALELLPWSFKPLAKRETTEPNIARKAFEPLLKDGILHQLAALDFILGNADRHSSNVMLDEQNHVKLIDHGSAFAGSEFDPAHDENSFVPCYLRAWASPKFNQLPLEQKLACMPRVTPAIDPVLRAWVRTMKPAVLISILQRYGINPEPTLDRFSKVVAGSETRPVDDVINRLWLTT